MSKILLVDPPWYVFQNINPPCIPLGLTSIATSLKEKGHECLIFNGDFTTSSLQGQERLLVDYLNYQSYIQEMKNKKHNIWNEFKSVLESFNPDYVVLSILTPKYISALEISRIIKTYNPRMPIIIGGVHPTLLPIETLKESFFDFAVVGEGEITVLELIKCLESSGDITSINGICYKNNGTILQNPSREYIQNLDDIPLLDFSLLYRFSDYPTDYLGSIMTSRGCTSQCIFCASYKLWGRKVRFVSPERVLEEIKNRYYKYGVKRFRFNDDTFTLNHKRIKHICGLILKNKLNITWMCDTRADRITPDILKIIKDAGCHQINIGVESGSEKVLNRIQKGESLETIKEAFALAKTYKIQTLAYFIMGFPFETKDDIERSIQLMNEIKPDLICWSLFTPYPGTESYELLLQNGIITNPDWSQFFHHSLNMNFSGYSNQEWLDLIQYVEQSNSEYISEYNRKNKISNLRKDSIHTIIGRINMYLQSPGLFRRVLKVIGVPANISIQNGSYPADWHTLKRVEGGIMAIDTVGKKLYAQESSTINVNKGINQFVDISGWAADELNKDGGVKTFLVFKGGNEEIVLPTKKTDRPDVASYFGVKSYEQSGWSTTISSKEFKAQCYNISLRILKANGKEYYELNGGKPICFV